MPYKSVHVGVLSQTEMPPDPTDQGSLMDTTHASPDGQPHPGRVETPTDDSMSELSYPAAMRILEKMKTFILFGYSSSSPGQQDSEPLSCEEIAMMLDCLQKHIGGSVGTDIAKLRVTALVVRGTISEDNFDRLGSIEYIDKAINYRRWAMLLTPEDDREKPVQLSNLGISHLYRFERLGELSDINKAIDCETQAVRLTPDGDEDKLSGHGNLGNLYLRRFERFGEPVDIETAIFHQSEAVQLTPDGHAGKSSEHSKLRSLYLRRFEQFGELSDVEKAIFHQTEAVQLTPDGHAEKPSRLNNLVAAYLSRIERLKDLPDIEKAIEYGTQAVQLTPGDHAERPGRLYNLGMAYMLRFEQCGDLADVDKAISHQTEAAQLTVDGNADKQRILNNLGVSHIRRFERLGELADAEKAITYQAEAVRLTPDGHKEKAIRLCNLGTSHLGRFNHLEELTDVEMAISYQTEAAKLIPNGHAGKPIVLNRLGKSHQRRFVYHGNLLDLDKAIALQTEAVVLAPDDHTEKPCLLNDLGVSFLRRFEHLGDLSDIEKGISRQAQAVTLTPESHANRPGLLSDLGVSYLRRFERLGELSDVDKSISCQTEAIQLTPNDHADKPARLNNLGMPLLRRFERIGELSDVDQAITCQTEAIQLTPKNHADKPIRLSNLGYSYLHRFERLGEVSDIEKAISCQTQAVQLTPDGNAERPGRLDNLGISYLRRFEKLGDLADAEKAISHQTEAVKLTPDGHADKQRLLNNLGVSYLRRFERLEQVSDINSAITYQSEAVGLTPDGVFNKPSLLSNLGGSYYGRFVLLGEISDIDLAISYQVQAVQLAPSGHAGRPDLLRNLGVSYLGRYEHLRALEDGEAARESFQLAAQLPVSAPAAQFHSARQWAKCSLSLGDSPMPAYQRAMELVPRLVWLGATIDQRYDLLIDIGDIAAEAAAWAISVEALDLAAEWLEEGRSIVWNQILQLRTPFDELFTIDPMLAQRLKKTGRELENAGSRSASLPSANETLNLEQDAQHHRRLATEWEQSLTEARNIPGFDRFMSPRKADELKSAAKNGPVVLINVHSTRCDALILFPGSANMAHVPLHKLSLEKAADASVQLASAVGQRGDRNRGLKLSKPASRPEEIFKSMLATLWLDIVEPILNFLAYTDKLPVDKLPRVTWCTTGALSFLPLHAAGCYNGRQPNAFDLVISSYTPTLSALLPGSSSVNLTSGLLAVGQEHTQGLGHLPNTVQELSAIKEHIRETRFLQLDGAHATVDAVLSGMEESSWVHLACHATQNSVNPAHSTFHLRDGNLTLETITKRSFKNKGLAFLSACQTAAGDGKRPDESIHLAAGMMMAGFPSVIATMWSIWDVDGPEIAGQVYAELLKDGEMDCTGVARALHKAVSGLREGLGQDLFKRWVPFIHIGV